MNLQNKFSYWRQLYTNELEHHIHRVEGLFIDGEEYYIRVTKSEGSGKVECKDQLVKAAIEAQRHFDAELDYEVTIIPRLAGPRRPRIRRPRIRPLAIPVLQSMIQVGGTYPPDMSPLGCEDLELNLGTGPEKVIAYSEPVVSALHMCGAMGVYSNPTAEQRLQVSEYSSELDPKIRPFLPEMVFKEACAVGRVKPSFEQFLDTLNRMFPVGCVDYQGQIRAAGLRVTKESWDDGSYEISIMLDHLHNHAYAHNGIQDPADLTELTDLLGGMNKMVAHAVHSILHIYDSLYMIQKSNDSWNLGMRYLERQINELIPDPLERRCYFRLLNKNADNFLVKDSGEYRYPYAIIADALPDKVRQYEHERRNLIEALRKQLTLGFPMTQTGTTPLLPNVDASPL
jgi:hypothetical protein